MAGWILHSGSTASSFGMVMLDMPMRLVRPMSTSRSICRQVAMKRSTEKGLEFGLRLSPSQPGAW